MTAEIKEQKRGWFRVMGLSRKWHYFKPDETHTVCGEWGMFAAPNALEDFNDSSSDNCAACKRIVAAMRAAEATADES